MPLGTCKTCKHWGVYRNSACDLVDATHDSDPKKFEISVDVSDDTGLRVSLITGPDFGCVHHVEKPAVTS